VACSLDAVTAFVYDELAREADRFFLFPTSNFAVSAAKFFHLDVAVGVGLLKASILDQERQATLF
jgi:hypothetical protein